MVDRIKVTPRLRDAAPDLCEQIDDLRKNRRSSLNRHSYLKNGGKEVEAAEELQRIKEIDATMAPLLAAAKEQLLKAQQTTCHSKLPSSRLPPLTHSKSEPPFLRRLSNMLRR